MPKTAPAIDIENITVSYNDLLALESVTCTLEHGTICALIGTNGAGKSTLFRTIMGLITPDIGRVLIDGEPVDVARKRGAIGYMPQSEDIDRNFPISVREVVGMGRFTHEGATRKPSDADTAAIDNALQRLNLTELIERQIGQLSVGQRKRVFLARVIAQEASVLLLDEPFAGVDLGSAKLIIDLLHELAESGCAILVASHELQAIEALADTGVLLNRRVLFQGDIEEALRPENLTQAFMSLEFPGDA